MEKLTADQITIIFLGFAVMLGMARLFGEFFTRFKQPSIVGELLAGILLGPTVLGTAFPETFGHIFPAAGNVTIAYQTIGTIGVVLLLMVAGLEIDLKVVWRQGKAAILISLLGTIVPFAAGAGLAYAAPVYWGMAPGADRLIYALFFGIALSISALPVIAKIMLDLKLFKTDVGLLVMGAAMLNDLIGWLGFSIVLAMMRAKTMPVGDHLGVGSTIGLTLLVFALSLTVGRWLVHRLIPMIQAYLSWPGAVISFTLVLTLFGAALTEAIGIHAVFGAFLAGIVVGDSAHLREKTRTILEQFTTYVFAPIFLVMIGLEANFAAHFNLRLVLEVLGIAFAGKLGGCLLGARLGNMSWRDSWAASFGMNARGAMEIILALIALQYGIIQEEVFIALVVLAIVSSLVSGPLMNLFIAKPTEWRLEDLLGTDNFVSGLEADNREDAINQLVGLAASKTGLDVDVVRRAVVWRERLRSTAFGDELAIPHARFRNLEKPVVVVGRSRRGIDFKSTDGQLVRLVFVVLAPSGEMAALSQLMEKIRRVFKDDKVRDTIYTSDSISVIRALVKTESAPSGK